jgi:hypothetical protein
VRLEKQHSRPTERFASAAGGAVMEKPRLREQAGLVVKLDRHRTAAAP